MYIGLLLILAALAGGWLTRDECVYCTDSACTSNNSCNSDCGNTRTETCRCNTPSDMLGCCKIENIKWTCVCPESECQMTQAVSLAEEGFDSYRTCPVRTAARFLSSACVPCEFRGKPAYLKDEKVYCSKHYVLLGVSCVGDIAVELDCLPCSSVPVYTVCRYAVIC